MELSFKYSFILYKSFFVIFFCSCTYKPFDKSKYLINPSFKSIIGGYSKGDSIIFINKVNEQQAFLITNIDSFLHDKKGPFINAKLSNSIQLHYKQVYPKQETNDSRFFLITTYPEDQITKFSIFFKNSYSAKTNDLGIPLKDLHDPSLKYFEGAYLMKNENIDSSSSSIVNLFIRENKGLVGFQQKDSTVWILK